jgi:hypothetical protein
VTHHRSMVCPMPSMFSVWLKPAHDPEKCERFSDKDHAQNQICRAPRGASRQRRRAVARVFGNATVIAPPLWKTGNQGTAPIAQLERSAAAAYRSCVCRIVGSEPVSRTAPVSRGSRVVRCREIGPRFDVAEIARGCGAAVGNKGCRGNPAAFCFERAHRHPGARTRTCRCAAPLMPGAYRSDSCSASSHTEK